MDTRNCARTGEGKAIEEKRTPRKSMLQAQENNDLRKDRGRD